MIKNKLIIIIVLCITLNSLAIGLATATDIRASVLVSEYSIYPEVLMPRDYGIITITLMNTAREMHITKEEHEKRTFAPWHIGTRIEREVAPIHLRMRRVELHSNEIEVITRIHRNIDIGPGQSVTLPFKIQAPSKTGIHVVEIRIELDDGRNIKHLIPIIVDNRGVTISADIPPITHRTPTSFELEIGNQRSNKIEGVNIIAMIDEGIIPRSSFIGTMDAGEIQRINFELFHNNKQSFNDISFKLEFWNGINHHTEVVSFPVDLIDRASVILSVIDYPSIISQGGIAMIELEVMNERTQNLTGVRIIPSDSNNFQIIPSEILVGNLRPGEIMATRLEMDLPHILVDILDDEVKLRRMVFNLNTQNLAIGKHEINFIVVYRDEDGRIFESEPIPVILTVTEPIPIVPISIGAVILILLIGVGYIIYKKMYGKETDDDKNIGDFLDDDT